MRACCADATLVYLPITPTPARLGVMATMRLRGRYAGSSVSSVSSLREPRRMTGPQVPVPVET